MSAKGSRDVRHSTGAASLGVKQRMVGSDRRPQVDADLGRDVAVAESCPREAAGDRDVDHL
jgi:hypothetical protein